MLTHETHKTSAGTPAVSIAARAGSPFVDSAKVISMFLPCSNRPPLAAIFVLLALAAGDAVGAQQAYAAALAERPNSGFALFGMARASEAAHQTEKARTEYVTFLDVWRNAEPTAPELAHAHQYLVGESVVASAR